MSGGAFKAMTKFLQVFGGTLKVWTFGFFLALAACASHQAKPPACEGPYTPLNAPTAADSHGK